MSNRFYISTPIYYPNGEPHLGHVYTTLAADTLARYHRLKGDATFLLTGTDEHGIKMVKTANALQTEPAVLADQNVAVFQQVFDELDVTYDDFIRTTQPRHKTAVQEIVRRLLANGDIYQGAYEGWYDEGQEEFITETEAKANDFKSAINKKPLVRFKEPTYFFRLTKYVPRIIEYIEQHPEFVSPVSRRNEVLSKLKGDITDLSISRATLKWGIEMPNDPSHVLFVWIDALSNYITALGYASADETLFKKFWPVDVHLIGKEILWFHAVYWPAMLMSLGLPLPKKLFAHGWWTANGMKMGKSTGNFIGLPELRAIGGAQGYDALRFYMLRAAPFGSDLDWTAADFQKAYKELSDVLGNLLNRVLKMLNSYRGGTVPGVAGTQEQIDIDLEKAIVALPARLDAAYEAVELQHCALIPIELARQANGYLEATSPFKLAGEKNPNRNDPPVVARVDTILSLATRATYTALVALLPILPEKADAALAQLNASPVGKNLAELFASAPNAGATVSQGSPLFPRFDTK